MHFRNNSHRSHLDSFQIFRIQFRTQPNLSQMQPKHRRHLAPPLDVPSQPLFRIRKCPKYSKIHSRSANRINHRTMPLVQRHPTTTPHPNQTRTLTNTRTHSTLYQPRRNQPQLRNLLWRCLRRQVHQAPRNKTSRMWHLPNRPPWNPSLGTKFQSPRRNSNSPQRRTLCPTISS